MKEKLSAMLDGDVDDATARALLTRLKHDKAFRDEWNAYCLLGDVVRGYAPPELDGFTERVMARLDNEPTIFVPLGKRNEAEPESKPETETKAEAEPEVEAEAEAMSRSWPHYLLPLAASVMGVLAVGGAAVVLFRDAPAPTVASVQIVETPATVSAVHSVHPVVHPVRKGARQDHLVAHQVQAGGPMPAVVQYVRTVSVPPEDAVSVPPEE